MSDHVRYLLARFSEHVDDLILVSNGPLQPESAEAISNCVDQVVVRKNEGFDVGGYKDGLLSVGFDQLAQYDELVLFNYTVFGPMFDLAEMFDEMGSREVDFWGLTEFNDGKKRFIQSYFIVTRNSLHSSDAFRDYWAAMPAITSIQDSLEFHEWRFTRHFEALGFRSGAYVQNEPSWHGNTTLIDVGLLLDKRSPLLKYRAFNFDAKAMERRGGVTAAENFKAVATRTSYPVDMIWDYIVSQTPSDQLIDSVAGARVVDAGPRSGRAAPRNVRVFLSIEDETHAAALLDRVAVVDPASVFVATTKAAVAERAEARGAVVSRTDRPFTGAAIAAFRDRLDGIVVGADLVFNLSCFAKERDTYGFREALLDEYWGPLIGSEAAVGAIGEWFAESPRVGVAFAPPASVVGRISRATPLCPRASNWTFDVYPGDLARAPAQSRWPWRGNAAFSGRLVRSEAFVARLGKLHGQSKHDANFRLCGPEGFIPELARKEGFACGLVVTAAQAAKLVARGSAEEAEARREAAALAETFAAEIEGLRRQLELTTAKAPVAPIQAKSSAPVAKSVKPSPDPAAGSHAKPAPPAKEPQPRPLPNKPDPGPPGLRPAAPSAVPEGPRPSAAAPYASPPKAASTPGAAAALVSKSAIAHSGVERPPLDPARSGREPSPRDLAAGPTGPHEAQLPPSAPALDAASSEERGFPSLRGSSAEVGRSDASLSGSEPAGAPGAGEPPETAPAARNGGSPSNGLDHATPSSISAERPTVAPDARCENAVSKGGESAIERAFRMTPSRLRFSHRLEPDGDTAVLTIVKGAERHAPVTVELGTFAYGGIAAFEQKNAMRVVKGWCFDATRPEARVYVAVVLKSGVLSKFLPCVLPRPGLSRKSREPIPHENCGFSLTVPDFGEADAKLVLANDEAEIVQLVDLVPGSTFGR